METSEPGFEPKPYQVLLCPPRGEKLDVWEPSKLCVGGRSAGGVVKAPGILWDPAVEDMQMKEYGRYANEGAWRCSGQISCVDVKI